ncbi:MAG TPA: universal stress protein [Puia sp.]|jgi:nucleotide-binding universal stress UspA family protein|nr:universal stress protein [Puia sp.]
MNNFIVPIDFSETSKNAARYAAHISTLVPDAHLILYNVFDTLEYGSDSSPLNTEGEEDVSRKAIVELALNSVKTELSGITNARISCVAEENHRFLDTLETYVKMNDIQLIIMGLTGATRLGQVLMGSNALNIVRKAIAPVIIVPPETHSQSAKNVLLLTDFQDIEHTIPISSVKLVLDLFKPKLYVVNVDHEHYVQVTEDYKAERGKLESLLKDYNPEFYFIRLFDFVEATNQFVTDYHIDLILTFPRRHSFLSNVFRTTSTSKLAYHSHVPIVAINA